LPHGENLSDVTALDEVFEGGFLALEALADGQLLGLLFRSLNTGPVDSLAFLGHLAPRSIASIMPSPLAEIQRRQAALLTRNTTCALLLPARRSRSAPR